MQNKEISVGTKDEQRTTADFSTSASVEANPMLSEVFPKTKECHCGEIADKYRSRKFINAAGYKVVRIFYRCRNCWSRIHEDFIPELDNKKKVDVFELLSNFR